METNVGIGILEQLLTGVSPAPVPFGSTNARIVIGDGNGSVPTPAATDTHLTATTNLIYLTMASGYPQIVGTAMVWQGTAASSQGNFAWNEWGIDNGGNSGPAQLFNHKGVAMGTKTIGTTWTFQASITQA